MFKHRHRIIFRQVSVVLLCSLLVTTQHVIADEYHDALASLFSQSQTQQVTSLFAAALQQQLQEKYGGNISTAFGNFLQSKEYADMLVNIFEPECRRRVTLDELNYLLEWNKKSPMATLQSTSQSLVQHMNTEKYMNYRYFMQDNITNIDKVVKNARKGKPTKIVTFSMPKSFRAEGTHLLQNTDATTKTIIETILRETTINALKQQNMLTDEDLQLPEVKTYLDNFLEEAIIAAMYKSGMSVKDLQQTNEVMESPAYQHYQEAVNATSELSTLVILQEMAAFAYYLKLYYPGIATQCNNLLIEKGL